MLGDLEQTCNTFRQSRRHRKSPNSTFEITLYIKHLTFGVLLKWSHQWVDRAALRDQPGRGRLRCDRALMCSLQRVQNAGSCKNMEWPKPTKNQLQPPKNHLNQLKPPTTTYDHLQPPEPPKPPETTWNHLQPPLEYHFYHFEAFLLQFCWQMQIHTGNVVLFLIKKSYRKFFRIDFGEKIWTDLFWISLL